MLAALFADHMPKRQNVNGGQIIDDADWPLWESPR
jgi:hypothetical protein